MASLQARIGPQVTKLYPNSTWKRPGANQQSPSKNTVKSSQTRQSDEKDDDSDASSHRHASSTFSSPNKSRYRSSLHRPRKSSGQLSLLSRMDLSPGASQDGHHASEGKEAAGIQPSLLSRVGAIEDQEQDFEDGELALRKTTTIPKLIPSQEQDFEDGELADSEPLPLQQVRDFLLPLMLNNAAHRVKEGDGDLTRLTAHSVLSDEVCSSFVDQMKEVRTEMHARSSNPPEMQLLGETNNLGAAHILPSSKIGRTPPRGPRAMIDPIITGKGMPSNGEIPTTSSLSKNQPISAALSNHSPDPISSSIFERREPGFRHSPSPEREGFHDRDRGRRYSQHRERFDDHRSHSHSPCRGQPYHRPSDSSRHMAYSRPPLATSPGQRRSPPGPSQSTYFRDRALRESPEAISGPQSASPTGTSNHNRIPARDFKRMEKSWNISPPRSPASRRYLDRPRADKVVSPHRPFFTHERGLESPRRRRDSYVSIPRSGPEVARRSVSPSWRKQYRRLSVERPLSRTPPPYAPWSPTPNPYCERLAPQSLTPNPYCQELERRWDLDTHHMESVSPGTGSMSTRLTIRASGSHHLTPKPMVIEDKDMHERVNNQVRTPKTSDDMQKSRRPGVLPCHNIPGVWFVKVALGDIGILECSFEVDDVTALNWNLRRAKWVVLHYTFILSRNDLTLNDSMNLPIASDDILQKERLQLHVCCLSQKDVQSVMDSLKPDATAHDVATAMLAIENNWPTPGHLIIMVNPQNKNKRVWLPHKLVSLTTSFTSGKRLSENETRDHHVCLFALRTMLLKDKILSSSFNFLVCQKGCLFFLQQGHFLMNCNMMMMMMMMMNLFLHLHYLME